MYRKNQYLKILNLKNWEGNSVDKNNRFFYPDYPFIPRTLDLIKWILRKKTQKQEKRKDAWEVGIQYDEQFIANSESNVLIWLGHASFYIRVERVSILIDPIFGDLPNAKRKSKTPYLPSIFKTLDYVLISHNHRDHCDKKSIQEIISHYPNVKFLTGLGNERILHSWTKSTNIQSAGWYQRFETIELNTNIYFMPSRHWSRRSLFDTNKTLWGAFVINTPSCTIYFGGDSGYGKHYDEVSKLFPQIDIAIIGIGTYNPSFESPMHTNPEQAIQAFNDLKAKEFIPMHYGTFDLSDEPFGEPLSRLNYFKDMYKIKYLEIGENYFFNHKIDHLKLLSNSVRPWKIHLN